ncbi:hypothetical protein D0809_29930 [Flavobacterium circumlabens]|uniref:Uncharacterized protein n=1 Tax=Flavobacterium circumlabens TaxID=2133765 RepID=A0A4Y7U462_9FLAO
MTNIADKYCLSGSSVISRKEKSSPVIPFQWEKLCRASNEDFSFVEMTNIVDKNGSYAQDL